MSILLETIAPPERGILDLNLQFTTNIQITSQHANHLVSTFVGNHIGDLLHGESPNLVIRPNGTYWRVPIALSSQSLGRVGTVGAIDVSVETGELSLTDQTITEIEYHAQRLAIGAAL